MRSGFGVGAKKLAPGASCSGWSHRIGKRLTFAERQFNEGSDDFALTKKADPAGYYRNTAKPVRPRPVLMVARLEPGQSKVDLPADVIYGSCQARPAFRRFPPPGRI